MAAVLFSVLGKHYPAGSVHSHIGREQLLAEAEAQVDPTVFLQREQSRIPNRTAQVTIQDDPPAEAMFGLVLLIVGQPGFRLLDGKIRTTGVKRITIGSPTMRTPSQRRPTQMDVG